MATLSSCKDLLVVSPPSSRRKFWRQTEVRPNLFYPLPPCSYYQQAHDNLEKSSKMHSSKREADMNGPLPALHPDASISRANDPLVVHGDTCVTPTKARKSSTPSSSTPSKRKHLEQDAIASPSGKRTGGLKWSEWETRVIMKAIVAKGEEGTNWPDVLCQINAAKSPEEARTKHSLRFYWTRTLKPKLLE